MFIGSRLHGKLYNLLAFDRTFPTSFGVRKNKFIRFLRTSTVPPRYSPVLVHAQRSVSHLPQHQKLELQRQPAPLDLASLVGQRDRRGSVWLAREAGSKRGITALIFFSRPSAERWVDHFAHLSPISSPSYGRFAPDRLSLFAHLPPKRPQVCFAFRPSPIFLLNLLKSKKINGLGGRRDIHHQCAASDPG